MLCLVTNLLSDPGGQASALVTRSKPLRQPGVKQDANCDPSQRVGQAVASLEDKDHPDR